MDLAHYWLDLST